MRSRLAASSASPTSFACEHQLDLDGDGQLDRAFLTLTGEHTIRLAVALAGHAEELVGTEHPLVQTEYKEAGSTAMPDPEFGWLVSWKVAQREGRELVLPTGAHQRLATPEALGDALWMSGGDAAAVLYRSRTGWVLMQLGY